MKDIELNGQNLSLPTPRVVLFPPDAVQLGWRENIPVGSGLVNSGTTCYINSTLQALFHVPSFVNWLLEDKQHSTICEKMNGIFHTECIVCAVAKTLQLSHRAFGSNIRPKLITDKVRTICKHLSPYRQEDAHEFLRYLMEAMEKSYTAILGVQAKKLDSFSKETTPLSQIFGGYIRTEVTCLECSHVSTTFQHFQDLILDIRQANTTTIYDALESYFSKERLDGDEAYHCERCKKKVSAYKKFAIEKAPNALCIQLKRFNINSFYGGSKISKVISTPQTIDLSKFKHKVLSSNVPLKYRLVSMIFHHGPSANSGHYTALGCTFTGSYYYFNDEQVFPVNLANYINNPNTYIMFYELEKPKLVDNFQYSIKSSASHSTTLSNGCININIVQRRTNVFFTKRENSFSSSSNHFMQPSSVTIENKNLLMKSAQTAAVAPTTVKSTLNSLVPYTQSSDSEESDVENRNPTDPDNNSEYSDDSKKQSTSDSSNISSLAKKNSTLTSLLTCSPKRSPTNRVPSFSGVAFMNGKLNNLEEIETSQLNGHTNSEERTMISLNFVNRDTKKIGSPTKTEGSGDISKIKVITNECSHFTNNTNNFGSKKELTEFERMNADQEKKQEDLPNFSSGYCTTNLINGTGRTNGFVNSVNGSKATASNGWIITNIEDETNNNEKCQYSKSIHGEWNVTEEENRKSSFASTKGKDTCKFNGNNDNVKNDSTSSYYSQNSFNNYSYSTHNGYVNKVLPWNCDLSRINKGSEEVRKDFKRSYSCDDEIERGKVKKVKHYNRSENNSSFSFNRKNLIQQQPNNQFRKQRWQFPQKTFHYNNNCRRYPHNIHARSNHYCRNDGYRQQKSYRN